MYKSVKFLSKKWRLTIDEICSFPLDFSELRLEHFLLGSKNDVMRFTPMGVQVYKYKLPKIIMLNLSLKGIITHYQITIIDSNVFTKFITKVLSWICFDVAFVTEI